MGWLFSEGPLKYNVLICKPQLFYKMFWLKDVLVLSFYIIYANWHSFIFKCGFKCLNTFWADSLQISFLFSTGNISLSFFFRLGCWRSGYRSLRSFHSVPPAHIDASLQTETNSRASQTWVHTHTHTHVDLVMYCSYTYSDLYCAWESTAHVLHCTVWWWQYSSCTNCFKETAFPFSLWTISCSCFSQVHMSWCVWTGEFPQWPKYSRLNKGYLDESHKTMSKMHFTPKVI